MLCENNLNTQISCKTILQLQKAEHLMRLLSKLYMIFGSFFISHEKYFHSHVKYTFLLFENQMDNYIEIFHE